MAIHIGTSGWSYDHWEGVLYPHGTRLPERLSYYVRQFQTVEVNSTYYRWPKEDTFAGWYQRLPEDFLMTVKAPGSLTHHMRLLRPERWMDQILGGLRRLKEKCGVLLAQLPPHMLYDYARLEYFLQQMPAWLRVAVEFRHASWHRDEVFDLLQRYRAAYCVMSGANLPCILRATAPFVYVRLHGPDPHHLYAGSYPEESLGWWAQRIREWADMQRDVYVYFNNDGEGNAVRNAITLRGMLTQTCPAR